MSITRTKFKVFFSLEKEEKWLNQQLTKGLQLVDVTGEGLFYHFKTEVDPDQIIQLDYHKFDDETELQDYLQFMADAGWRHIAGNHKNGTQYFISDRSQNLQLFSDIPSLIEREKRIRNGFLSSMALLIPVYLILFAGDTNLSVLWNPGQAFLTPGLWEKTGGAFVTAFLFELPFALLRILGHLILPIFLVMVAATLLRSYWRIQQYQNQLEN